MSNNVEELVKRVSKLEKALNEIVNYNAYSHPDEDLTQQYNDAVKESNECTACQYAKEVKWPPSGLCNKHYRVISHLEDRISEMYNNKQIFEPIEIARKALKI